MRRLFFQFQCVKLALPWKLPAHVMNIPGSTKHQISLGRVAATRQGLTYNFTIYSIAALADPNGYDCMMSISSAPQPLHRPLETVSVVRSIALRLAFFILLSALLTLAPAAEAAMDYAKQVLIGADFHGADLRGVTFNLTNLRDADFHDADLRNASLFGAKLQDADLSGADLREATLDSAVMEGTDLRNARLDDAFAFNTKFIDVRIDGADFSNVPLRGDALKALCAVATGTNPASGRATRDTLGCG